MKKVNKENKMEERDFWGRTREEAIRAELNIPKDKESFCFSYTVPSLDWFDTIPVKIKPTDYYYFTLEKRFGNSWHLIGSNPPLKIDESKWKETEIGEIGLTDLKRFIKWANCGEYGGSRITAIKTISGDLDIIECLKDLVKE